MRFYESDGSCKINQEDCEFGWRFCDILNENPKNSEKGNDFLKQNKNQKYRCKADKSLIPAQTEDFVNLTYIFECNKKLLVEKHEPHVKIHDPVYVQKSQMNPEGYVGKDDSNPFSVSDVISYGRIKQNKNLREFENFNSIREKLSDMISSNSSEGKLLISFVDAPKFKKLKLNTPSLETPEQNIPELKKPSVFLRRHFMKRNFDVPKQCSWSSFLPNNEYQKNKKSLMEEMFRKGLPKSDNVRLINPGNPTHHLKAQEKLNCQPLDSLKLSETETCGDKCKECIEVLYRNLKNLNTKILEMREELICIRVDFQEEDKRTARLLQESRKLLRELKECNYLNEILLLLMGEAEKIKSNNWPFKISRSKKRNEELNLIV